jgi:plastocyanin
MQIFLLSLLAASVLGANFNVIVGDGFDLSFKPVLTSSSNPQSTLSIKQGDSVTWIFSNKQHSVTQVSGNSCKALAGGFGSGLQTAKTMKTYTKTFDQAGVFDYICDIWFHCSSGMRGKITVSS